MIIKNFKALATTPAREAALHIVEAGLAAIDTAAAMGSRVHLRRGALWVDNEAFPLNPQGRLLVVGVGKCAVDAARALEKAFGDHLEGGAVIDVKDAAGLTKIKGYRGTHPLPSAENTEAARALLKILESLRENDTVVCIISGGGSTLLCLPEGRTCEDEAHLVVALTKKGATIQELNTVRKHLSLGRGGYLAKYAYPARVVSLIFSDVPGDDLQFIASGPTVKDATTVEDAKRILEKYNLLSGEILEILIETPKDEKYFAQVANVVVISNRIALGAMAEKAKEAGFSPEIRTTELSGEACEVGEKIIRELRATPRRTALLYGGETTVTVRGEGRGGRNQELALSALGMLADGELVAAIASDGRDNTDFAGALSDTATREKAKRLGVDPETYLKGNNAYEFFSKTGDHITTGDTGSNVADLIIALKE